MAGACAVASSESQESDGFVSVKRLLDRLDLHLILRPLLVEGMIASKVGLTCQSKQWVVLVDSERYGISERDVDDEASSRALPDRFRSTIAHEAVHAIALRAQEFGVQREPGSQSLSRKDFVRKNEREAEVFASRLLVPESVFSALIRLQATSLVAPSVPALVGLRRKFGVSRFVLMCAIRSYISDDKVPRGASSIFQDSGIGVGEWGPDGSPYALQWPCIVNFQRNLIPAPFLDLIRSRSLNLARYFELPNRGSGVAVESNLTVLSAGTEAVPNATQMRAILCIENITPRPGSTFFFEIRRVN
jgi:hypothetical protein